MPRLRDGIHFDLSRRVVADARRAVGDVNVVSHAHADHLLRTADATVVCSSVTAALVEARAGTTIEFTEAADGISLLPAGHIVGSRAALIEDAGRRHLYTGDLSIRDRGALRGFEPVPADELVIETTYGHPRYRFPDQRDLEAEITDWLADADAPLCLFGYALGRAQEIQRLAGTATNRRVVVHDSIHAMNEAIAGVTDGTFPAVPYSEVDALRADDVVIAPNHCSRNGWVAAHADRHGALRVGFSGWAVDDSFLYRGGYDRTFTLSDHCDFDELQAVVTAVDPERVYTHHGFDEGFAAHLAREHGYEAYALKRNQTTLADF